MQPHEHFLLALLPISAYVVLRHRRLPTGYTVLTVLLATQLPDVIDKPLSTFGVIPSGRMIAHSIIITLPLLSVCVILAAHYRQANRAMVFSLAYLAHIAGDFYPILWKGTDLYYFPNLFWPLMTAKPDTEPWFTTELLTDPYSGVAALGLMSGAVLYIVVDIARRKHQPH